jgi:hypothetical protein
MDATGTVTFEWLPSPFVRVAVPGMPKALFVSVLKGAQEIRVRLPASPSTQRIKVASAGRSGLVARLPDPVQMGPLQGLSHLLFHLPRFPRYDGEWISRGRTSWRGRVVCEGAGWRVAVDSTKHSGFLDRRLETTGGFGITITHVGRLERIDRAAFSADDATDILDKLSYFFSFARGAWSCCVMPVGFNDGGQRRWAEWSAPHVSPAAAVFSWFSTAHPATLAELFPGFLRRSSDGHWWAVLRSVLSWYLQCNSAQGPLESAIVLQQCALELLAQTMFVEEGRCLEQGFRKMPASGRIRLMLKELGVPIALPTERRELLELSWKRNWADGPHAITDMRNAIVHPKEGEPIPFGATVDAWRLGMWYLELVLLWLFDFRGEYKSRLSEDIWPGQVERVPWIEST